MYRAGAVLLSDLTQLLNLLLSHLLFCPVPVRVLQETGFPLTSRGLMKGLGGMLT